MNYIKSFVITQLVIIILLFISCKPVTNSGHENTSVRHHVQELGLVNLLLEMDTNNDSQLSEDEVKGPLLKDFSVIDKDNDGFLSAKELANAPRPEGRKRGEDRPNGIGNVQKDFDVTINVNTAFFIEESLLKDITTEERILNNGTKALCYVITTTSRPNEHSMGPWCPNHIEDGKDKGGIWFENEKVYDVDGHFIANLKEFYSDDEWALFREDGSVKVTKNARRM